jgi:DNA-binding MurR/RpiR family transcriptional regulator
LDCLAVAKKRGAFCIVITSCQRSPAAELGDVVLLSAIRGPEMFNENEFSKIAQIAILDALYFNFIKNDL